MLNDMNHPKGVSLHQNVIHDYMVYFIIVSKFSLTIKMTIGTLAL